MHTFMFLLPFIHAATKRTQKSINAPVLTIPSKSKTEMDSVAEKGAVNAAPSPQHTPINRNELLLKVQKVQYIEEVSVN